MKTGLVLTEQARHPPVPPEGYKLVRYEAAADGQSGKFLPPISTSAFPSLLVWIPDLVEWVKPKWIIGDESRWFAIKEV